MQPARTLTNAVLLDVLLGLGLQILAELAYAILVVVLTAILHGLAIGFITVLVVLLPIWWFAFPSVAFIRGYRALALGGVLFFVVAAIFMMLCLQGKLPFSCTV